MDWNPPSQFLHHSKMTRTSHWILTLVALKPAGAGLTSITNQSKNHIIYANEMHILFQTLHYHLDNLLVFSNIYDTSTENYWVKDLYLHDLEFSLHRPKKLSATRVNYKKKYMIFNTKRKNFKRNRINHSQCQSAIALNPGSAEFFWSVKAEF